MSEFLGKRLVHIELLGGGLPQELEAFHLLPVAGAADLYELPYCSLNCQEWGEFERVMYTLKVRGKSRGWRVVGMT